ncbi:hypothetical protein ACRS3X_14175 [Ectopseudomonas hydrolytica]
MNDDIRELAHRDERLSGACTAPALLDGLEVGPKHFLKGSEKKTASS